MAKVSARFSTFQRVRVNGRPTRPEAPAIRADDGGLLHGDGAFETLRLCEGRPRGLQRHLTRLRGTLGVLQLEPPANLEEEVEALLAMGVPPDGVLRVSVSRGPAAEPTLVVAALAAPPPRRSVELVSAPGFRRAMPAHKTLSYLPCALLRRLHPSAEPVLLDGADVLEGITTNVFARLDGRVVTPPADGRILPGVVRAVVVECGAVEAPVPLDALGRVECFVTNAVHGLVPVTAVDGRPAPTPGPWLAELRERCLARLDVA